MNEEALKDAYGLFTQSGYNGTQDEFYTLLSENAEAFADSYGLFKNSGYNGSEDEYKNLLGLKKKRHWSIGFISFGKDSREYYVQFGSARFSYRDTSKGV